MAAVVNGRGGARRACFPGPVSRPSTGLNGSVGQLATNGADAVVLHKGSVRRVDPAWFTQMSLVVDLSASTAHAPDPDAKRLVATVEAARRTADMAVVACSRPTALSPSCTTSLSRAASLMSPRATRAP
ncbi:hypothetical protein [Streptomyces sp. cg40]|uniref:hypothetical protein n=1 Tax=Streptomyces sp. cg40 TaxID=3419764 RepID=UPI003D030070